MASADEPLADTGAHMEVDHAPGPTPGQEFVEDVHNLVLDYCADGLEAFFSCVSTALTQRGADQESCEVGPSGGPHDNPLLASVGQGTQRLYDSLASKAAASLTLFEAVAASGAVFRPAVGAGAAAVEVAVPQVGPVKLPADVHALPLLTPTREAAAAAAAAEGEGGESAAGGGGQAADVEDEAALLARIAQMKQELMQVDQRCAALRAEVQRVDRHIISAGDASDYLALSATATSHKATIAAIAAAAENLANMMARAAALRAGAAGADPGSKLHGFQQQAGVHNAAATSLAAVGALAELVRV